MAEESYEEEALEAELIGELEREVGNRTTALQNAIVVPVKATEQEMKEKVISEERRIRELEIAVWAENEKLLGGEPTAAILKEVYERLVSGKTLVEALDGICGIKMWTEWRKEYPAVLALEEQARAEYSNRLEKEILQIADQRDRTRFGEVNRDKVMIDARQRIIDRNDRLTEARLKAQQALGTGGAVVPVQINVKYGKE